MRQLWSSASKEDPLTASRSDQGRSRAHLWPFSDCSLSFSPSKFTVPLPPPRSLSLQHRRHLAPRPRHQTKLGTSTLVSKKGSGALLTNTSSTIGPGLFQGQNKLILQPMHRLLSLEPISPPPIVASAHFNISSIPTRVPGRPRPVPTQPHKTIS
jgi:hypothetical protein